MEYWNDLYDEQVKTNRYLDSLETKIDTIIDNDLIYKQDISNSFGLVACGLYILIFVCMLLFIVTK